MRQQAPQSRKILNLIPRWHRSISFRLCLLHLAAFGLLVICSMALIFTMQRSLMIKQGEDFVEQVGLRVVSDLNGLILQAQNQTRVMADMAQVINQDTNQYKKIFGNIIIPADMQNVVAGGGIWPEPYTFDPDKERSSFFWGVQPNGTLKFYNEYNDPKGPGYHNEHWYIPARYYPPGAAIWSHSYTDPYSKQPMVTCTVPIYKEKQFSGVATIDLKLDGLNKTLQEATRQTQGYMFVIDRKSRFVAFPHMNMIRRQKQSDGKNQTEYLHLADAAITMPGMARIEKIHHEMNIRMIQNAQQHLANFPEQIELIQAQYPSLSHKQTKHLLASMFDQTQIKAVDPHRVRRMRLEHMPLMDEPSLVSVFHMPRTYWNVVMVTPVSQFTQPADQASAELALWLGGLEIITILVLIIAVRKLVIAPLKRRQTTNVQKLLEDQPSHDLEEDMDTLKTAMDQIKHMVEKKNNPQSQMFGNSLSLMTTDIKQLLSDLLKIDQTYFEKNKIRCETYVAFNDLLLLDTYRLTQVLTNLIANAKFALGKTYESKRNLNIQAQLIESNKLQITLTDTGCGIEEHLLKTIFDHGFTTRANARGVGLHSAQMAIKELCGTLEAHSDGLDCGTTLTLTIPVRIKHSPNLLPESSNLVI